MHTKSKRVESGLSGPIVCIVSILAVCQVLLLNEYMMMMMMLLSACRERGSRSAGRQVVIAMPGLNFQSRDPGLRNL